MDVAAEVVTYLTESTGIPWYHDRPRHAPAECGTVTRDGGPTELVRDMPTLTLIVYAASRGRAADLAALAKGALLRMQWQVPNVFGAEVMGDYYDPVDGMHRHRVTASLIIND